MADCELVDTMKQQQQLQQLQQQEDFKACGSVGVVGEGSSFSITDPNDGKGHFSCRRDTQPKESIHNNCIDDPPTLFNSLSSSSSSPTPTVSTTSVPSPSRSSSSHGSRQNGSSSPLLSLHNSFSSPLSSLSSSSLAAVKFSKLQASFAEKTAIEMQEIVTWYSQHPESERFTKVSQSQSLPDNAMVYEGLNDATSTYHRSSSSASVIGTPLRSNRGVCGGGGSCGDDDDDDDRTEAAIWTSTKPKPFSPEVQQQLDASDHLIRLTRYMADIIGKLEQASLTISSSSTMSSSSFWSLDGDGERERIFVGDAPPPRPPSSPKGPPPPRSPRNINNHPRDETTGTSKCPEQRRKRSTLYKTGRTRPDATTRKSGGCRGGGVSSRKTLLSLALLAALVSAILVRTIRMQYSGGATGPSPLLNSLPRQHHELYCLESQPSPLLACPTATAAATATGGDEEDMNVAGRMDDILTKDPTAGPLKQ